MLPSPVSNIVDRVCKGCFRNKLSGGNTKLTYTQRFLDINFTDHLWTCAHSKLKAFILHWWEGPSHRLIYQNCKATATNKSFFVGLFEWEPTLTRIQTSELGFKSAKVSTWKNIINNEPHLENVKVIKTWLYFHEHKNRNEMSVIFFFFTTDLLIKF